MAAGAECYCGSGLKSDAGLAAPVPVRGRGSELLRWGCFGAGGAASSVRAGTVSASVRKGRRRARPLGSAEECGCARLPTGGLFFGGGKAPSLLAFPGRVSLSPASSFCWHEGGAALRV